MIKIDGTKSSREKLTKDGINERILDRKIVMTGDFIGVHRQGSFKCLVCEKEWESHIVAVLYQNGRCPICSLKHNSEDINKIIKSKDFILAEKYKGMTEKHKIQCLKCSAFWEIEPKRIIEGRRCPNCSTRGAEVQKRFEDKLIFQKIKLISKYRIAKDCVKLECLICGKKWFAAPSNVLRPSKACPHCSRSISLKKAEERLSTKNIIILGGYHSFSRKADLQCNQCLHIWQSVPDRIYRTGGCPLCNTRRNEKLTLRYLQEIFPKTDIIHQHRIEEKIFILNYLVQSHLVVDFMFFLGEKKFLVEYNGVQHYEEVNWGRDAIRSKKNFLRQKLRDKWLRRYCKTNHIHLIEIDGRKYKEEKIKDYLTNKLSKYSLR